MDFATWDDMDAHIRPLNKLRGSTRGIRGSTLGYLDVIERVGLEGQSSDPISVLSGVAQGWSLDWSYS